MIGDGVAKALPSAGGFTVLAVLALAAAVLGALALAHLVATGRAVITAWRQRITTALLILPGLVVLAWIAGVPIPWQIPTGVLVLGALLVWRRYLRTADVVARWGETSRRKAGVASMLDVARTASTLAMRRQATTVRPSLRLLTRRARLLVPTRESALLLVRAGLLRVWSSVEDVTLVFGGPRTGKTGWLAGRVLDAPGALLVTSTRTDLHDLTAPLRSRRGPVFVFNAVGLGGLASTITFDPLTGCADPVTAVERATDLLTVTGTSSAAGDREYWEAQARRVLAALLHAAALGELGMRDVLRWVADPDKSKAELTSLLRRSPEPAYVQDATQFVTTNDRTRSSITSTIMPALGWLTSPAACAAAAPSTSYGTEVSDLLGTSATVYLLGAPEAQSAPLVAAFTGHIAREARRLAAHQPGGRLDPPLTLALDEAALMSPPLDDWTSDMGGRGVTIVAAFQSRAQMLARWGDNGSATILNNTASIMVFGGTRDRSDLDYWSNLAGDRDEPVTTVDEHGRIRSRTVRKTPVLAPAQIANLPARRVIVFRRGMPPVVGRARMAWERRDVRRLELRQGNRLARVRARWVGAWDGRPVAMRPFSWTSTTTAVDLETPMPASPTPTVIDLGQLITDLQHDVDAVTAADPAERVPALTDDTDYGTYGDDAAAS